MCNTLYIVQYCSLRPDRLSDLLECQIWEKTDVTRGRPLHLTMLFLFYFGVREGAVATAKEGLWKRRFEVKREALFAGFWSLNCPVGVAVFIFTLNEPAILCMEDGNLTHKSMIFCTAIKFTFCQSEFPIRYLKIFHGYTHNRFQHTALNLEYFAFWLSDHDFNTVCKNAWKFSLKPKWPHNFVVKKNNMEFTNFKLACIPLNRLKTPWVR